MMMSKLTFKEWLASQETEDGSIETGWLDYWNKVLPTLVSDEMTRRHNGDCTKESNPCGLCMLERLLSEYREYFFSGVEL
jgi:hypothetical protein